MKPIFASPPDFSMALLPEGEKEEQWYIFSGDRLLINKKGYSLPQKSSLSSHAYLYLGTHKTRHIYVAAASKEQEPPKGWIWKELRSLHGLIGEHELAIAGRALQLIDWDQKNHYCGRCGTKTKHREKERCRECPSCGYLSYPKLAPAIMALVKREDKILLARGPHFPKEMYSVLAGYLDPGETLEQCVAREVFEEVGIKVKNICYFGSQPWPFSRSLMIAFLCDWEEGEIQIDEVEIEKAGWFGKHDLPKLPPNLSISRLLIDSVL